MRARAPISARIITIYSSLPYSVPMIVPAAVAVAFSTLFAAALTIPLPRSKLYGVSARSFGVRKIVVPAALSSKRTDAAALTEIQPPIKRNFLLAAGSHTVAMVEIVMVAKSTNVVGVMSGMIFKQDLAAFETYKLTSVGIVHLLFRFPVPVHYHQFAARVLESFPMGRHCKHGTTPHRRPVGRRCDDHPGVALFQFLRGLPIFDGERSIRAVL